MDPTIALSVFPVIFLGELPDKTMFASLVLSSRGRPLAVWSGAAAAFLVHVIVATTVGAGLFALFPERAVDAVVAVLFAAGAGFAFWEATREDEVELVEREAATHRQVLVTAFVVIFIAEWGDLTQILTANLAAHYGSALSVGVGAVLALWAVAAIAVAGGRGLLRYIPVRRVRQVTGVVLLVLAALSAYRAIRG
ncbi:MAG TPA: TMEM165/GDT1 family protein [Acidimicrobiales bacterium]|nr:TMEM165/GDT1 family protein [Acidimicrobiales bacterium]